MKNIYSKQSDSDEIYVIKVLITATNSDAIFLEGLDLALMGVHTNKYGKDVPVYNKHTIVEFLSNKYNKSICQVLKKIDDIIESYIKKENDIKNCPIFIDILWGVETEIDKKDINSVHHKIKNIKYKKLCCDI